MMDIVWIAMVILRYLPLHRHLGNMKLKDYLTETSLERLQKKCHVSHYRAKRIAGYIRNVVGRTENYEAEFVKRLLR